MKKVFLLLATLTLTGGLSAAIYTPDATLGPCAGKTLLSSYLNVADSGCVVGDKEFSSFQTVTGTNSVPGAWEVNIVDLGLDRYRLDVAQAGDVFLPGAGDYGLQYVVKVVGSTHVIRSVSVSINPGGGDATIRKEIFDFTGNALGASLGAGVSSGGTTNITLLPPSQWIRVVEVIHAPDDLLSSFTDVIRQGEVPEPATYAMMGLGLAALGLIARRKKA